MNDSGVQWYIQQRSSAAVFRIVTRWEGRARSGEQIGAVSDTVRCGGGWKDESFRQKIRDKIDERYETGLSYSGMGDLCCRC